MDEALFVPEPQADALAELDDALQRLEALDPRQGQIVEQRYFGGLSLDETAEALGVSLGDGETRVALRPRMAGIRIGRQPTLRVRYGRVTDWEELKNAFWAAVECRAR